MLNIPHDEALHEGQQLRLIVNIQFNPLRQTRFIDIVQVLNSNISFVCRFFFYRLLVTRSASNRPISYIKGRLRNLLPTVTRAAFAQALRLPILDYTDVSNLNLTEAQLDQLERLQNFCIQCVLYLRKYDHVVNFIKCSSGFHFALAGILPQ